MSSRAGSLFLALYAQTGSSYSRVFGHSMGVWTNRYVEGHFARPRWFACCRCNCAAERQYNCWHCHRRPRGQNPRQRVARLSQRHGPIHQNVVAGITTDRVGTQSTYQQIGAVAAKYDISGSASLDNVVAIAGVERIGDVLVK